MTPPQALPSKGRRGGVHVNAEWEQVITNCDNLSVYSRFKPFPPFAFTEQGVAIKKTSSGKGSAVKFPDRSEIFINSGE